MADATAAALTHGTLRTHTEHWIWRALFRLFRLEQPFTDVRCYCLAVWMCKKEKPLIFIPQRRLQFLLFTVAQSGVALELHCSRIVIVRIVWVRVRDLHTKSVSPDVFRAYLGCQNKNAFTTFSNATGRHTHSAKQTTWKCRNATDCCSSPLSSASSPPSRPCTQTPY